MYLLCLTVILLYWASKGRVLFNWKNYMIRRRSLPIILVALRNVASVGLSVQQPTTKQVRPSWNLVTNSHTNWTAFKGFIAPWENKNYIRLHVVYDFMIRLSCFPPCPPLKNPKAFLSEEFLRRPGHLLNTVVTGWQE